MMEKRVNSNCEGVADLWRTRASVQVVEEQQRDLAQFMQHVNTIVSSLKQQFGSLVDDVKAHFDTAQKTIGRSAAEQMNTMRIRYQDDTRRVDSLKKEIENFVLDQKSGLQQTRAEMEDLRSTANSAINDLKNSMEALKKR